MGLNSQKNKNVILENQMLSIVDVLVKNGADINATDSLGHTALDFARLYGYEKVAKFLHEKGAITYN